MAGTPAASRARRFHSPESSPNHSNIHSWVPSGLVTKPSRDMTILRITFRSLMPVETHAVARTHRPIGESGQELDATMCRRSGSVGDACLGGMQVTYLVTTILAALANGYAAALNFVGAESVKAVADRLQISRAWMVPLGTLLACGAVG